MITGGGGAEEYRLRYGPSAGLRPAAGLRSRRRAISAAAGTEAPSPGGECGGADSDYYALVSC